MAEGSEGEPDDVASGATGALARRVVFDTGVVLQAALNPDGPAARALLLMDAGAAQVYVSNRLRAEYEQTLSDPLVRARFPRLTQERVGAVLSRLDALSVRLPNPPRRVAYPRDPDDEPVINLAVHVEAHYIAARDRDLLDLAKDPQWSRLFPALRIVDPVTLLQEVEREQALRQGRQQQGRQQQGRQSGRGLGREP